MQFVEVKQYRRKSRRVYSVFPANKQNYKCSCPHPPSSQFIEWDEWIKCHHTSNVSACFSSKSSTKWWVDAPVNLLWKFVRVESLMKVNLNCEIMWKFVNDVIFLENWEWFLPNFTKWNIFFSVCLSEIYAKFEKENNSVSFIISIVSQKWFKIV